MRLDWINYYECMFESVTNSKDSNSICGVETWFENHGFRAKFHFSFLSSSGRHNGHHDIYNLLYIRTQDQCLWTQRWDQPKGTPAPGKQSEEQKIQRLSDVLSRLDTSASRSLTGTTVVQCLWLCKWEPLFLATLVSCVGFGIYTLSPELTGSL